MKRLFFFIVTFSSFPIFGQSPSGPLSIVLFDGDSISDALSYSEIEIAGNVTQLSDSVCSLGTVGHFPGNSHLQFPGDFTFNSEFSFSMFVKPNGSYDGFDSTEGAILVNKEEEYELALKRSNGAGQLQYALQTSNQTWSWTNTFVSLPFDHWSHVVWQFNNGICEIALNGELVHSLEQPGSTLQNGAYTASPSILRVGARAPEQNQPEFAGSFEDIYIFDRALSLPEMVEMSSCFWPVFGCLDAEACNFDSSATIDNGTCLFFDECGECGGNGISGCVDTYACNFDENASCDNGTCDYSCCPGPGCCDQGLTWNWELSLCQDLNPADINLDGCVQLGDLLTLLGAYGDCGEETTQLQCGDPLEYQGYDYETVQIGEQCWFAENLRAEQYRDESTIPKAETLDEWPVGYGVQCSFSFDEQISAERGLLYNGFAVNDERKLCPSGWHVPTDEEFMILEDLLGMPEEDIQSVYWRGTNEGAKLRTSSPLFDGYIGTDEVGFNGVPAGTLFADFGGLNYSLHLWSSTSTSQFYNVYRAVDASPGGIYRSSHIVSDGHSIRCIQDSE